MRNLTSSIRLLRAGVVPRAHIEELSVGYDGLRDSILTQLVALEQQASIVPWIVKGEWGSGKSHFLSYLSATCRDARVATSSVSVNARAHALNKTQYYYPIVARSLECPLATGIRAIVRVSLTSEHESLRRFVHASPLVSPAPLGRAIRELLRNQHEGSLSLIDHPAWMTLTGDDLAFADYSYLREKALRRLQELATLMRALGYGGLVLLFDEVETVNQLWNIVSRMSAYRVLGILCRMKHVWCVFATTDRCEKVIDADLADGILNQPQLSTEAKHFLRSWRAPNFRIVQPPTIGSTQAGALAQRVSSLYGKAYRHDHVNPTVLDGCIRAWRANPSGNPRTLIRSIIHHLDTARGLSHS